MDIVVRAEKLKAFCSELFQAVGESAENANLVAETLVEADLRGVHSHGVMRMRPYIARLRQGGVKPRPEIRMVIDRPSITILDGDGGSGQLSSVRAMRSALEKAKHQDVALAGVRNSSHFGACAYYSMMALEEDMIGFATTNTTPTMAPWGGTRASHGNNPFSYALPAGEERPIVLDMAVSVVAWGKINLAASEGKKIPPGWAVDKFGRPTEDPKAAMDGGLLLPVGGYKGYGLAAVMDVLSGVLTGANFGLRVPRGAPPNTPIRTGHFFIALNVAAFMPIAEFKADMDEMIRGLKASPVAEGYERIYLAGEMEYDNKEARLKVGIPLVASTVKTLEALGQELGVKAEFA